MIARAAALALLLWAFGFVAFATTLPGARDGGVTDGIVVVTGGAGRLQRGFALLAAGRARRLLVAGVDRRVRPGELAREYRVPRAMIACCVDLGRESVDTRSNAGEAAAWAGARRFRSLRLVTTDWHVPRARFELARALPPGVRLIVDGVPSEPTLPVLLGEYNKYLLSRATALAGI